MVSPLKSIYVKPNKGDTLRSARKLNTGNSVTAIINCVSKSKFRILKNHEELSGPFLNAWQVQNPRQSIGDGSSIMGRNDLKRRSSSIGIALDDNIRIINRPDLNMDKTSGEYSFGKNSLER